LPRVAFSIAAAGIAIAAELLPRGALDSAGGTIAAELLPRVAFSIAAAGIEIAAELLPRGALDSAGGTLA
jgi:hypothetical protein